ncbi:MAG: hypothetical protein ACEQSB_01220 [Undibacterium sp.]
MVTSESEDETNEREEREDDKPLSEEERQKLFEAAKSAMTRTS